VAKFGDVIIVVLQCGAALLSIPTCVKITPQRHR